MADDGPGSPLKRRVPGATGAGPVPLARTALPDALIARMQAAVDAAHEAQGAARAADDAEPVTEPLPALRAAVAAQDWPTVGIPNGAGERGDAWNFRLGAGPPGSGSGGLTMPDDDDALDDLAESYLAADPDLTAGFADDAGLDEAGPDGKGSHRLWSRRAAAASGWQALGHDEEPGSDVRHERAAWWDHAVQSGRSGRAPRSPKPRGRFHVADVATPEPQRSDGPPHDSQDPGPAPIRPRPAAGERGRRRARAMVGAVALAVVLVVGGVVAVKLASRDNTRNTKVSQLDARREARIRAEAARLAAAISDAATWVVGQVDHTAKVACDRLMCQALTAHGLPDQGLYALDHQVAGPAGASILVDTPALRRQLGASTPADWAPTVLASFGRGSDQIAVRVLAPHGAGLAASDRHRRVQPDLARLEHGHPDALRVPRRYRCSRVSDRAGVRPGDDGLAARAA